MLLCSLVLNQGSFLVVCVNCLYFILAESPKEGKGNKPSPLPLKNAKRKVEGGKQAQAGGPVNG